MEKTDRNKKVMHMLDLGMSMAAIARYIGVSRQRVLQIVNNNGGLPKGYVPYGGKLRGRKDTARSLLSEHPIAWVAREMDVYYGTIQKFAEREGIQPIPYQHLEPGCPKCATRPYARGYCRTCYARWQRKEKRNGKESND